MSPRSNLRSRPTNEISVESVICNEGFPLFIRGLVPLGNSSGPCDYFRADFDEQRELCTTTEQVVAREGEHLRTSDGCFSC